MDAARYEFGKAGLSGARIEEIALRAGVTKQLIYHYYKNKNELYIAVLDEAVTRISCEHLQTDYASLEPLPAVRLFFENVFDQYERWPHLTGLRLAENIHCYKTIKERMRSTRQLSQLIAIFVAIIERGQAAGLFLRDIDPRTFLGTGMVVITGCFINDMTASMLFPVDVSTQEGISFWREHAVQFVLSALCVRNQVDALTH